MAHNPFKNVPAAMVIATMPIIAPIQDLQVGDMVKAYHHEEMYETASIVDDPNTYRRVPGWQDYDYLDITPETWQIGKFTIEEEDGSIVELEACRPKKWFEVYNLKEKGDEVWLETEEMGIAGYAVLQEIRSTDIDTRYFKLNEDGKVDRPVISTYKRLAKEISDFTFSNGQVISCTSNHPFYSSYRKAYVKARDLIEGETIQTAGEKEVKFIGSKERKKCEYVYNLEVWRDHNYFVGFDRSIDFVLVHNSCGRNQKRYYSKKFESPLEHIERGHTRKNNINKPLIDRKPYFNEEFDDVNKINELLDDVLSDTEKGVWKYTPFSNEKRIERVVDAASNPKYQKYLDGNGAIGYKIDGTPVTKFYVSVHQDVAHITIENLYPYIK